jgi:hypothetical protein
VETSHGLGLCRQIATVCCWGCPLVLVETLPHRAIGGVVVVWPVTRLFVGVSRSAPKKGEDWLSSGPGFSVRHTVQQAQVVLSANVWLRDCGDEFTDGRQLPWAQLGCLAILPLPGFLLVDPMAQLIPGSYGTASHDDELLG